MGCFHTSRSLRTRSPWNAAANHGPDLDRAVVATRRQPCAIWAEGESENAPQLRADRVQFASIAPIPDLDFRRLGLTIRRELARPGCHAGAVDGAGDALGIREV